MNAGELGAKTFLIPQYQDNTGKGAETQFEHIAPYDDNLKPENGLQYVQGQTADYYRKVANLKSFMQHAHTNYGIDVRVPDAAKGHMAIKLNELYNMALADIMSQGNLLKTSHERLNTLTNQRAHFLKDTTLKPAEQQQFGQDYTFEEISPLVKESNDAISKALYDNNDFKSAQKIYEGRIQYFENQKKQHPELSEEYQRQIEGLNPPRKGVFRPSSQNAYERIYGKKVEAAGNFVDDVVHLANGVRDSYEPDTSKLNAQGNPMLISNEFSGTPIGKDGNGHDVVVKYWEMNPDTKNVDLVLSSGKRINGKSDAGTIMRMLVQAKGSNMGIDVTHLEEFLDKYKLQDQSSQVNQEAVLSRRNKKWVEKQEKILGIAKDLGKAQTQTAQKELENSLTGMSGPGDSLFNFWEDGQDKQIGAYLIHKGRDNFEIKNLAEVEPPSNFSNTKQFQTNYASHHKFTSIEGLKNFLIKRNAHMDLFKNQHPELFNEQQSQAQPTNPQVQQPPAFNPTNY